MPYTNKWMGITIAEEGNRSTDRQTKNCKRRKNGLLRIMCVLCLLKLFFSFMATLQVEHTHAHTHYNTHTHTHTHEIRVWLFPTDILSSLSNQPTDFCYRTSLNWHKHTLRNLGAVLTKIYSIIRKRIILW